MNVMRYWLVNNFNSKYLSKDRHLHENGHEFECQGQCDGLRIAIIMGLIEVIQGQVLTGMLPKLFE